MEFKGTKGKWILRENLSTVMSEENCLITRVFDGKGNALLERKEQSEEIVHANALLISKAPKMLEQLYVLYEFYETLATKINSDDFDEDFRAKWNPIMSKTEQIIKEATEL